MFATDKSNASVHQTGRIITSSLRVTDASANDTLLASDVPCPRVLADELPPKSCLTEAKSGLGETGSDCVMFVTSRIVMDEHEPLADVWTPGLPREGLFDPLSRRSRRCRKPLIAAGSLNPAKPALGDFAILNRDVKGWHETERASRIGGSVEVEGHLD